MTNSGRILFARGVILLTLGLFARGTSFAEQPKVKPVQRITVVDSKGNVVGITLGGANAQVAAGSTSNSLNIQATVLLEVDHQLAVVKVAGDRFFGGILLFESENCSGTAWFAIPPLSGLPSLLPQAAVAPPGQTLFVETPGGNAQTVTLKSRLGEDHFCAHDSLLTITTTAVQAKPLVDLLTVFTPPFSLKAAP